MGICRRGGTEFPKIRISQEKVELFSVSRSWRIWPRDQPQSAATEWEKLQHMERPSPSSQNTFQKQINDISSLSVVNGRRSGRSSPQKTSPKQSLKHKELSAAVTEPE